MSLIWDRVILTMYGIVDPGGCYLGFSKSAKFRVWIPAEMLSSSVLKGIEQSSSSASELATSLFTPLFKDDLKKRPMRTVQQITTSIEGRCITQNLYEEFAVSFNHFVYYYDNPLLL